VFFGLIHGCSPEHDEAGHLAEAPINGKHLSSRLHHGLDGDRRMATAGRFTHLEGRIGVATQLVAHRGNRPSHKAHVGAADHLEHVRARKGVRALQQRDRG